eukprot:5230425-Pyramimonas_sp.AAC.1
MDMVFIIMVMAQKCMQGGLGFVAGSADIPKAFDFVCHLGVLQSLQRRGVPDFIAAWFLRHLRSIRYNVHLVGDTATTSPITRGVPQGSAWGPAFFKM